MSVSEDNKKIDIAIISAMPEELNYFYNKLEHLPCTPLSLSGSEIEFPVYNVNGVKILLGHTGFGASFAAGVYASILSHFHPEYILIVGTAGGIDKNLKLCDVVAVEEAFEAEIQSAHSMLKDTPFEKALTHPLSQKRIPTTYRASPELIELLKTLDIHNVSVTPGKAVSSDQFPAPIELYKEIKEQKALAIDMETSSFYQMAWLLGGKAIAIRGLSNLLNRDGTDDEVHLSDVEGSSLAAGYVAYTLMNKIIELKYENKLSNNTESTEVAKLIRTYQLQSHPEGGYYVQTYRSQDEVKPSNVERYQNETRSAGTSILFLLNKNDFSAWHVLRSDEIWHYHKGSAIKLHVIDETGQLSTKILGDPLLVKDAEHQVCMKAGNYFAAENIDKSTYSLAGCTVTPGFEYKDFHLCSRSELLQKFPQHLNMIERLTHEQGYNPNVNPVQVEENRLLRR